jgi:carbon starvation protein
LNDKIDLVVAGTFLLLVAAVALLSIREWLLLLARRKPAVLRETAPTWLPDYAVAPAKPLPVMGLLALGCALAEELSGEAHLAREGKATVSCLRHEPSGLSQTSVAPGREARRELYLQMTERRFRGVNRCC